MDLAQTGAVRRAPARPGWDDACLAEAQQHAVPPTSASELVELFDAYRSGGYASLRGKAAATALSSFYCAVVAYGEGKRADAAAFAATAAAREPESLVFGEAARWLVHATGTGRTAIYDESVAFEAFIRGGGNVG